MKIALLGHGVVGSGVSKIIDSGRTDELDRLEVKRILVKDESEMTDPRTTLDFNDILNDPEIGLAAECMGGLEPAHTFVKKALESGKHVVTSNKKMLAVFFEELMETAQAHHVTLAYEASVGGGIPWIADLTRIRRIEMPDSFRGIFNGTTNYILSGMYSEGKEFEDMLAEAQKLGYAEQDPSDDIDGMDVRYKCSITASAAFDRWIGPEKIPVFGIRHIRKKDLDWGRSRGLVCKLIGSGKRNDDGISVLVRPVFLKADDTFAGILQNYNAIESISATLGKAVFIGQGAGSLPTAHAVVQDMVDIVTHTHRFAAEKTRAPETVNQDKAVWYIRTSCPEAFAAFTAEKIGADTILTEAVSMDELLPAVRACADPALFLAEVAE